jgi:hypothetical protein
MLGQVTPLVNNRHLLIKRSNDQALTMVTRFRVATNKSSQKQKEPSSL